MKSLKMEVKIYRMKSIGIVLFLLITFLVIQIGTQFIVSIDFLNEFRNDQLILTLSYLINLIVVLIFIYKSSYFSGTKNLNSSLPLIYILTIGVLLTIIKDPIYRWKQIFSTSIIHEGGQKIFDPYIDMLIFFNIVLLIPIVEELLFRKSMIGILRKSNFSSTISLIISSSLFALIHFSSIESMITSWLVGFCCGFLFLKDGIKSAIILHAGYNFFWYVLSYLEIKYWALIKILNFNYIYWLIILVAMFLLSFLIIKINSFTTNHRQDTKHVV